MGIARTRSGEAGAFEANGPRSPTPRPAPEHGWPVQPDVVTLVRWHWDDATAYAASTERRIAFSYRSGVCAPWMTNWPSMMTVGTDSTPSERQ